MTPTVLGRCTLSLSVGLKMPKLSLLRPSCHNQLLSLRRVSKPCVKCGEPMISLLGYEPLTSHASGSGEEGIPYVGLDSTKYCERSMVAPHGGAFLKQAKGESSLCNPGF